MKSTAAFSCTQIKDFNLKVVRSTFYVLRCKSGRDRSCTLYVVRFTSGRIGVVHCTFYVWADVLTLINSELNFEDSEGGYAGRETYNVQMRIKG